MLNVEFLTSCHCHLTPKVFMSGIRKTSLDTQHSEFERSKMIKPNILVVGDLMIDHYLMGSANRISPEAPVQVVDIQEENFVLGGAGNVINNLLALGCNVSTASVIGDDDNGRWLIDRLKRKNINTSAIIVQEDRYTSKKTRLLAANQQIVRFDLESKDDILIVSEEKIFSEIRTNFNYDLILLSDYAKGVLTPTLCQNIIKLANLKNIPVFVDPKGEDYSKYKGASLITPNKKEASLATKIDIKDNETLLQAGLKLKNEYRLKNVIITLSDEGMAIFDEELTKIKTAAKEVYDVTGAGDTVLASLGYAISNGMSLVDAAKFANLAAGVVVGKIGSATATLTEIEEYRGSLHKNKANELIKTFDEIEELVNFLRAQNKKIVFTNGCFDILHLGHIKYLEEAKDMGDVLIVGVNSDKSVSQLKGSARPVNPEYDRAYLLSALECIDYTVIFNDATPYRLIGKIKPDILVKGSDYQGKEVVGSDISKETRLINFVDGKSTTKIIKKIQRKSSD